MDENKDKLEGAVEEPDNTPAQHDDAVKARALAGPLVVNVAATPLPFFGISYIGHTSA